VDIGEREACGGELYDLFNARLKQKFAQRAAEDEEYSESEVLEECLAEVAQLVNSVGSVGHEIAGGLASGIFEDYFCPTPALVDHVVEDYKRRYGAS
jgi:hypothetical protein